MTGYNEAMGSECTPLGKKSHLLRVLKLSGGKKTFEEVFSSFDVFQGMLEVLL